MSPFAEVKGPSQSVVQRALQTLESGMDLRLTLIRIGPEVRQQVLLMEWITTAQLKKGRPVAWLDLTPRDDVPLIFLDRLLTSLGKILPDIPSSSPCYTSAQFEERLIDLLNALALFHQDFTLVIRDYHFITQKTIHQGLQLMLDYPPCRMHLVVASQSEPPLHLARLRARRHMVEIDISTGV